MNFTKISHPTVTAAPDEFVIRKIMRDSKLKKLPIEKITLAGKNPFGDYEEFMLNDLIENIRLNGILSPVLVRELEGGYELVDGSARYLAAKTLGETELSATVITCSDEESVMIAFECNLCRRSIKDLKLSIQARIISDYYNTLKKQGMRSDLIYRAAHGEERMMYELEEEYNRARGKKVNTFLRRFANKYERYDVKREVMERYGISGANIARMLRINQLIDPLKQYADEGKIGFTAAVQLSFLTDEAQGIVAECIKEGAKIDVKTAGKLKQTATSMRQRGEILSPEKLCAKVRRILLGAPPKPLFNKKSKAAPFSVAADASPQEENKPYKRIPDIEKYLKERFPAFFPENPEDMPACDVFIRRTLYYFVRLNDACCSFFPDFFKPSDDYVAVLQKIFDATILYFEGLVLGTIQPPPEGI